MLRTDNQSSSLATLNSPAQAEIVRDGKTVSNENAKAKVGERISLGIQGQNLGSYQCQWSVRGLLVSGYTASQQSAVLTPLHPSALRGQTLQFHWVSGGSYKVGCTLTIGSQEVLLTPVTIEVLAPACDFEVVRLNQVAFYKGDQDAAWNVGLGQAWDQASQTMQVCDDNVTTQVGAQIDCQVFLQNTEELVEEEEQQELFEKQKSLYDKMTGIYFSAEVDDRDQAGQSMEVEGEQDMEIEGGQEEAPEEGTWCFVQLVRGRAEEVITGTRGNRSVNVRRQRQFGWVLDTVFPYGRDENEEEAELNKTGGDAYTCSDTPHFNLAANHQSAIAENHFRMFILYKSDRQDSIFVPLQVVQWGWMCKVGRTSPDVNSYSWILQNRSWAWLPPGAAPGGPGGRHYAVEPDPTSFFPVWTENVANKKDHWEPQEILG